MQTKSPARGNLRFAWRVVKLLARGFALALLTALLVLVLGLAVLHHVFDAERVKAIVVTQLQEIAHRPVQIEKVLLTPGGIKLTGIKIIAKTGLHGHHVLESDFALVTIKLRPLLERRLELSRVRLSGPRIVLSRDAEGRWNVADLFASTASARGVTAGRFFLPLSLAAEETVIEDGVLIIEDDFRKRRYEIDRFNLDVRGFDLEKPFTVSASFNDVTRLEGRDVSASCAVAGSVFLASFDWAEAYIAADKISLDVDGKRVLGSVRVHGFPQPVLEAALSLPALGPEDWRRYSGRTLDLNLPLSLWQGKLRLTGPRRIEVESLQVQASPLSMSGSGQADWSGPRPELEGKVVLGEFPLQSAAAYRRAFSRYQLRGLLQGEAQVSGWLDRLVVHQARLKARGFGGVWPKATVESGDVDLAAADDFFRVSGSLSQGSVSAFGSSFTGVRMGLALVDRDLKIDGLSLKWGDSNLSLKARVLNISNPKEISVSGNLDSVHWETAQGLVDNVLVSLSTRAAAEETGEAPKKPWVQTFKYVIPRKFPDTVGHVHIGAITHKNSSFLNADLLWDLHGVSRSLKKTSGDIRVGFGPGRVTDLQAVQDSSKILRIVFLPYVYMHKMNKLSVLSAATAYPTTFDFGRIEGQYSIERGVVMTRFFHVDSPQLVAFADGAADFANETVDMNVLTRLTSYQGSLPEWWVDEAGRPAIGFRVKGNLNQPDLEPRLHKMAADEIEKALREARGKAQGRLGAIKKLKTL